MKKTLIFTLAAVALLSPSFSFAIRWKPEKIYTKAERQAEEKRIAADIEKGLDQNEQHPKFRDSTPDGERILMGAINESVLLSQKTGERFGVFEGFDDEENRKVIELRLHKKNKLFARFPIYSAQDCDHTADVRADQVSPHFIVFTTACYNKELEGGRKSFNVRPFFYDYKSNSLRQLEMFNYDPLRDKGPRVTLENGIYKMRWKAHERGDKRPTSFVRNFKIFKDAANNWTVKDVPPFDPEAPEFPLEKSLLIKPQYNLPAYVADWGK